jgi:hypothetical protein
MLLVVHCLDWPQDRPLLVVQGAVPCSWPLLPLLLLVVPLVVQGGGPGSDIFKLVMMVMARGYDPLIVFSFSKRECESMALGLTGLDLNSDTEKQLVEGIFR